jgi:uncharacterized OB-fold protein
MPRDATLAVCSTCGQAQLPSGSERRQCPDCDGWEWVAAGARGVAA